MNTNVIDGLQPNLFLNREDIEYVTLKSLSEEKIEGLCNYLIDIYDNNSINISNLFEALDVLFKYAPNIKNKPYNMDRLMSILLSTKSKDKNKDAIILTAYYESNCRRITPDTIKNICKYKQLYSENKFTVTEYSVIDTKYNYYSFKMDKYELKDKLLEYVVRAVLLSGTAYPQRKQIMEKINTAIKSSTAEKIDAFSTIISYLSFLYGKESFITEIFDFIFEEHIGNPSKRRTYNVNVLRALFKDSSKKVDYINLVDNLYLNGKINEVTLNKMTAAINKEDI